jgi:hypothetical protein
MIVVCLLVLSFVIGYPCSFGFLKTTTGIVYNKGYDRGMFCWFYPLL